MYAILSHVAIITVLFFQERAHIVFHKPLTPSLRSALIRDIILQQHTEHILHCWSSRRQCACANDAQLENHFYLISVWSFSYAFVYTIMYGASFFHVPPCPLCEAPMVPTIMSFPTSCQFQKNYSKAVYINLFIQLPRVSAL